MSDIVALQPDQGRENPGMADTSVPERISPPIRLLQLGQTLQGLREQAGLTGQQVAERTGITSSALSRLERGQNRYATAGDVHTLLNLYGAEPDRRQECLRLVTTARITPYWAEHRRGLGGLVEYVAYETEAELIRYWHPVLVPGLLQTEEYAWAVLTALRFDDDPSVVALKVRARLARQWITRCPTPAQVHAIVAEGALRQPIGGPEVLRGQLDRLAQEALMPHITVQVLPNSVGAHPGMSGGFVLLSLPSMGDALFVESGGGGIIDRDEQRVEDSGRVFGRLSDMALSPDESAQLISDIARS
ncbi:helix-turn-helix domain-containing protein [Nonomuraea lactucae]|uniref:helix-turn-helix domain-containing protein n=1 Tax=Nonomuraea lactucae TaxID=2249762 RepID=UPI0013B41E02|nr:helix-turn-helix transcriptional regulator [Nonomuraea lactucae]